MMKPVLLAILLWLCFYPLAAQQGCTDPLASNYNPIATINNGSCMYAATNYTLVPRAALDTRVNETSGLVYVNGDLWTFNDSGNSASLYKINQTDGQVLQTVAIGNATNVDWEDITADDQYIYIGDFGNNINGNRRDLKIYKIEIADLYAPDPVLGVNAQTINFAYADQTDFTARGNNNTEFDCEAFFVKNNQLHLFTKDWVANGGYQTKHYTIPTVPGSHIAILKETLNVNGAITGADISKDNIGEIVLIGYHPNPFDASIFMWFLFDYQNDQFFSGNKRRIELGKAYVYGQIEGVTYIGNGVGYVSSERIDFLNISARLYNFTSINWVPLPVDLINFSATYIDPDVHISWQTASETESDYFTVERSTDGVSFEEIYRQKAAGMSRTLLSYSFTDRDAGRGTNHYRLKQIDRDGKYIYSSVQTVEVERDNVLQVSPVPVKQGELLNVRYSGISGYAQISLRDMNGNTWLKERYTLSANQQFNLATAHLKRGIYMLQIIDAQKVLIKKVLVL